MQGSDIRCFERKPFVGLLHPYTNESLLSLVQTIQDYVPLISYVQGRTNRGGTGGTCPRPPPPNFFEGPKVPFFVMKSALFVQANVAVTPFCLEISMFLKNIWSKTCNFGVWRENVVNVSEKIFLGAFSISKSAPGSRCRPPPQSFDASYAPGYVY
jgi:hypothetical protein